MHIKFDIVRKKGMTDLFAILRFECTIPIEMSILEGGYFLHSKNWNQEEGDAIHL